MKVVALLSGESHGGLICHIPHQIDNLVAKEFTLTE